jgi:hypothetical protein
MEPRLIEFPLHKDPTGNLVVADECDLPFEVKRIFWVFDIEGSRGDHALKTCHQLIVPMSGIIGVVTRYKTPGLINSFILEKKRFGLYLPPMIWRAIRGTWLSTFFVLCSHPFDEDDYIDGVDDFEKALMENAMQKGLKFSDEVPKS